MTKRSISIVATALFSFCASNWLLAQETSPVIRPVITKKDDSSAVSNQPGTAQRPLIIAADQFSNQEAHQAHVKTAIQWNELKKGKQAFQPTVKKAIPSENDSADRASIRLANENRTFDYSSYPKPLIVSPMDATSIQQSMQRSEPQDSKKQSSAGRVRPLPQPAQLFPQVARLPKQDLPPVVSSPKFNDVAAPAQIPIGVHTVTEKKPITTNRGVRPKTRWPNNASIPMNSRSAQSTSAIPTSNIGQQIPIVQRSQVQGSQSGFPVQVRQDAIPAIRQPDQVRIESRAKLDEPSTEQSATPSSTSVTPERGLTTGPSREKPIRKGLLSQRRQKENKINLTSYFDRDPVELGSQLPKFTGVTEIQADGSVAMVDGCSCGGCTQGLCDSPRCQYDINSVNDAFQCCGMIARARNVYRADALYWYLGADTIVGSTFFGLPDYEGAIGGRFGFTQKDGVRGREFVIMGFETWTAGATVTTAFPGMSITKTSAIFPPIVTAPFFNATTQTQTGQAKLFSFEGSRTWWGWDVVKTQIGFRYIYFSDEFRLTSSNFFGTGNYFHDAENHMIGPQIGMDVFYDVGQRVAFSFVSKIAGGVNIHRTSVAAATNGAFFLDNSGQTSDWMWNFELGTAAHWKLGPCARFRLGVDLLAMFEVNNPHAGYTSLLLPTTGNSPIANSEIFAYGFSFGFEIFR